MSHPLDFPLSLVPGTRTGIVPDGLALMVALPTVNPGDDDEEDDEDSGNIEPEEDEGVDDDEDDDEDDPLWARAAPPPEARSSTSLVGCKNSGIRRASLWRHTARPACRAAF
jgi:hypothetical protein